MEITRRKLLKTAAMFSAAGLIPGYVFAGKPDEDIISEGFVSLPESHETFLITQRKAPVTIMVSKAGQGLEKFSFCREMIDPDDYIPIHKHGAEAEMIYIQHGKGTLIVGDKKYSVVEGSVAYVPENVWHGLRNTGLTPLMMVFSYTPGGFEGYFREIGAPAGTEMATLTPEDYKRIDAKYQITYKSNPPGWE